MSEPSDKSLAQLALDLLLYAPAGFVATIVEDIPTMAAKGRGRIEGQVRNAHIIGQFAVTMGQQQLKKRMAGKSPKPDPVADAHAARERSGGTGPAATSSTRRPPTAATTTEPTKPATPPAAAATPSTAAPSTAAPSGNGTSGSSHGNEGLAEGARATATAVATGTASAPPTPVAPARNPELRATVDGAIPGYDTLSASQVVKRLDGLGPPELAAVSRHEASNRGRRTILFRAQQLLEGDEAVPGAPTDGATSPD